MTQTLEFNSREEWLENRRRGIGSSDAPIILGKSPYSTPFQLWQDKLGLGVQTDNTTYIQQRGNELEPVARELFAAQRGSPIAPKNIVHPTMPVFMASLDGLIVENGVELPVEIKFVGKAAFAAIADGQQPPEQHAIQVQHQLMCMSAPFAYYVAYNDEVGQIAWVKVMPDEAMQMEIASRGLEFWERVKSKEPPELTTKDYVKLDTPILIDAAAEYKELKARMKETKERLEQVEEILKDAVSMTSPAIRVGGLKVSGFFKKGNVAYDEVPELQGVDLEKYRKAPRFEKRITG